MLFSYKTEAATSDSQWPKRHPESYPKYYEAQQKPRLKDPPKAGDFQSPPYYTDANGNIKYFNNMQPMQGLQGLQNLQGLQGIQGPSTTTAPTTVPPIDQQNFYYQKPTPYYQNFQLQQPEAPKMNYYTQNQFQQQPLINKENSNNAQYFYNEPQIPQLQLQQQQQQQQPPPPPQQQQQQSQDYYKYYDASNQYMQQQQQQQQPTYVNQNMSSMSNYSYQQYQYQPYYNDTKVTTETVTVEARSSERERDRQKRPSVYSNEIEMSNVEYPESRSNYAGYKNRQNFIDSNSITEEAEDRDTKEDKDTEEDKANDADTKKEISKANQDAFEQLYQSVPLCKACAEVLKNHFRQNGNINELKRLYLSKCSKEDVSKDNDLRKSKSSELTISGRDGDGGEEVDNNSGGESDKDSEKPLGDRDSTIYEGHPSKKEKPASVQNFVEDKCSRCGGWTLVKDDDEAEPENVDS